MHTVMTRQSSLWLNRLAAFLTIAQGPIGSRANESFLFMDLRDVQGPWGLLQPRASKVNKNTSFVPPYVNSTFYSMARCLATSVPR